LYRLAGQILGGRSNHLCRTTGGTATDFDLYVRSVLPANTGFNSGQISTINLTGNENYFIYWMHNVFLNSRFSNIFFNSGLLVPGQHVSIAGPFSNGTVTVKRVVLRQEGHTGTWVVGSTTSGPVRSSSIRTASPACSLAAR